MREGSFTYQSAIHGEDHVPWLNACGEGWRVFVHRFDGQEILGLSTRKKPSWVERQTEDFGLQVPDNFSELQ